MRYFSIFIVVALFFVGCGTSLSTLSPLVNRLKDRGVVTVSDSNPFLASNLLLTKVSESSPELKGFLGKKGNPEAIEVSNPLFGSLSIKLFYPSDRGYYLLVQDSSITTIEGPFNMDGSPQGINFNQSTQPQKAIPQPNPTQIPQPETSGFKSPALVTTPNAYSDGEKAEVTPKGDVVHYVTTANEDMDKISQWYTGEANNSEKLKRLNNIHTLEVGDTVIIPSYMVKQTNRMP